ncbi:MAG: phosphonate C-P lyase system protein PhnG [Alphaproteobacteria bacterium]
MAALARAPVAHLEAAWSALADAPSFALLRAPEVGMVMVRGRSGGTGPRFNLGEMTVTRCVVRLDDGRLGFGYVAGRDRRHAELAAAFDALLQDPVMRPALMDSVVMPAEAAATRAARDVREKAAATRVQFFTMVRGE